ncbi:hypothetical protein Dimus_002418 [Dionaea muscipula]
MSGRVREKERGRVGDRRRDKDDRHRKASDRARRHVTPDRTRSRRRRTPSSEPQLRFSRRRDDNYNNGDEDRRKGVSDLVDGIAREHQQKQKQKGTDENNAANGGGDEVKVDAAAAEIEMMKKLAMPMGFDSTKGKPVPGADVSGVRVMTKLQPRQYMNRRGGFSRSLPAERNR